MKQKHFTLVEVLVVVGIIAILAGMIIPAVGMARASGRKTECLSNQGQLAKLLTHMMTSNNQYLVSGTNYTKDHAESAWTRYLYDKGKLQDLKGYRCPSLITNQSPALGSDPSEDQLKAAIGVVTASKNHGGSKFYGFDFRGTKLLKDADKVIVAPSQLLLGGCSADKSKIAPAAALDFSNNAMLVLVHSDEVNGFFLDGHAESLTTEEVADNKFIPKADGTEATKIAKAEDYVFNPEE